MKNLLGDKKVPSLEEKMKRDFKQLCVLAGSRVDVFTHAGSLQEIRQELKPLCVYCDFWEDLFTHTGSIPRQKGVLLMWKHVKESGYEMPATLQEEVDYILMGMANRAEKDLSDMYQEDQDRELKKVFQKLVDPLLPDLLTDLIRRGKEKYRSYSLTDAAVEVQSALAGTPLENWKVSTIERAYREEKNKKMKNNNIPPSR